MLSLSCLIILSTLTDCEPMHGISTLWELLWQQSCSNTRLFARPATRQEVSLHDSLPWVCIHKTTIWRRYTLGRNNHGYPGTNHYPVPPDGLKGLTDDAKHKLLSLELLIDFRGSSRDEPRHERAWANRTSSCKHTYVVRWSTQFRACITRNFHVNERPIDKTEKTYLTL